MVTSKYHQKEQSTLEKSLVPVQVNIDDPRVSCLPEMQANF